MSSTLLKLIVVGGILATLAISVVAPRLGLTAAVPPAPSGGPPAYGGAKLVPPPPGMR